MFNVGHACFALSTRILDSGFSINLTNQPWSYKLRTFLVQSCVLLSLSTISLATIDQFISMTSYRPWNNLKLARRHVLIACCIWSIHGIFAFLYWDTLKETLLLGYLPIIVMLTFSVLAFVKIRSLSSRQMNIACLSRDRQLTAMTLLRVSFVVLISILYTTFNIYELNTVITNPNEIARFQLIETVFVLLYYENFASSFYIFCLVSKRFRTQLVYVLVKIHINWLRQLPSRVKTNQITPSIELYSDRKNRKMDATIHEIALQIL